MSQATSGPDVVARHSAPSDAQPSVAAPATAQKRSALAHTGQLLTWLAVLLVGAVTLIAVIAFTSRELKTWSLVHADDQTVRSELTGQWPERGSAGWFETLAELGLQVDPIDTEHAMQAAVRATARDPSRAGAWAMQAYLETQKAGQVNAAALEALSKSMDACPVCDQDLIRWRFNFVLANWSAIPDPLRRKAFEQADILRWMGDNSAFLAEMRIKAAQAGIPFDEYRSAVDTPVRTWDLAPVNSVATAPARTGG